MPEPRPSFLKRYPAVLAAISVIAVAASSIIVINALLASGTINADDPQYQDLIADGHEGQSSSILPTESPVSGALAPDFTLVNLEGETVHLHDFLGHPIIINFWATWCGPCRIEMPILQDRFMKLAAQDLVILAVNFDESRGIVEAFREEVGITFEILLDPGARVQRLYQMRGYPSSFFVDRRGTIQVHHIGLMTEDQIDASLMRIGIDV